jgi:hypothetical protein
MQTLKEEDFKRLSETVNTAIEKHARGEDHIALRAMVKRQVRIQEQWDKFKVSVLGALTIGILFWVGSIVASVLHIKIGN